MDPVSYSTKDFFNLNNIFPFFLYSYSPCIVVVPASFFLYSYFLDNFTDFKIKASRDPCV